jgi:hypothetical protein
VVSSNEYPNYTIPPLAVQAVLILVAPSLLAASIYMELGRLMIVTGGEHLSPIRRTWLTKIFVVGDVISFFFQGAGKNLTQIPSRKAQTQSPNPALSQPRRRNARESLHS